MTGKQRLLLAFLCGATLMGGAAWADAPRPGAGVEAAESAAVDALMDAARLGPLMAVVATEGARHGAGLEAALFPGRGGRAWSRAVARIQSPERLSRMLAGVLATELDAAEMREAAGFYASPLGAKVARAEVDSRRAMLDGAVEAEALNVADAAPKDDPRSALVAQLIDGLDLVGANVSGGLNANYAFYRGLGDGGAMTRRLSESELLAMVWQQEGEVRETTSRWLDAYLTLAYGALSEEELRSYVDWAASAVGRRTNAALFAGFGAVFERTSYELGLAAAGFIVSEDA
ncbi:DUF2059 domain-containing protein [Jannaschia sp. W003]|uniref:DUF2059 domain-containing protein n=1 Tax=Jannaschia sp. W003 TaxID=2867012 RepID=UPI0021A866DF|nr:DUF2059 domain-containing protein [Jannaschia sp. W003]UWQ20471.1 DUF2059 domain-containing protein [Jannaschia sp. W003]